MNTTDLVQQLKVFVAEVPDLIRIKEGFHNPHVKAWKTKLEGVLVEGGSTCSKALANIKLIRSQIAGSDFIKSQTYRNQLECLERVLKQTIQTIEILGRPEDNDILPHWGKPKCQHLAAGHIMVGQEEVDCTSVTIHEVLDCLVSLSEDSSHLSESMRHKLISNLNAILEDDLLQPFLEQSMDHLLGHWPEFSDKSHV